MKVEALNTGTTKEQRRLKNAVEMLEYATLGPSLWTNELYC